jgi:hypothetical protein
MASVKNRDPETQEWIQKRLDLRIRLSRLDAAPFGLIVFIIVAAGVCKVFLHRS